jgi:hypothetical protein
MRIKAAILSPTRLRVMFIVVGVMQMIASGGFEFVFTVASLWSTRRITFYRSSGKGIPSLCRAFQSTLWRWEGLFTDGAKTVRIVALSLS